MVRALSSAGAVSGPKVREDQEIRSESVSPDTRIKAKTEDALNASKGRTKNAVRSHCARRITIVRIEEVGQPSREDHDETYAER
jgi:hypothetical protein